MHKYEFKTLHTSDPHCSFQKYERPLCVSLTMYLNFARPVYNKYRYVYPYPYLRCSLFQKIKVFRHEASRLSTFEAKNISRNDGSSCNVHLQETTKFSKRSKALENVLKTIETIEMSTSSRTKQEQSRGTKRQRPKCPAAL